MLVIAAVRKELLSTLTSGSEVCPVGHVRNASYQVAQSAGLGGLMRAELEKLSQQHEDTSLALEASLLCRQSISA